MVEVKVCNPSSYDVEVEKLEASKFQVNSDGTLTVWVEGSTTRPLGIFASGKWESVRRTDE